ncbi:hypothetical protein DUI87_26208 [Hirundo rustica rustica]|uniref:ribonuclease H n=1 Tax=Hirundo rustica rustica TaxID=333673 RepID=A0A3M0J8U3_HIRRU|nr:hypothetical protein DUI87_26208 [Hirundo rustica rustica]
MQTVTEEKRTKNKATVSASTQTITEEKGTKNKATVSVSTQAVTEEKETKGAISISTQTVTEAEQPKPVAVAPVQKKKSKSKSVRIMTDEDVAGPSHPAEETEPEIITRSLSLGELHDLRREFTRQTNESILTWLLRIWDAAANDTILDGSEARTLGSLSRDVVIDQGIGRTQQTLSLWRRLLTSVRDRYLCKEDLQVHQGKWSTMEQGIRCLRELAVLEIIFSEDERFPKSPDDVQCTSQMWLRFARLGPEMYSRYLATLQWREGEDKVEERDNRIYWTVWIRWPGTSDPQKYTALVDTGAQCTLMPSRYVGTESISISGVTGGSQQLTVLEAEVSLTGNGWQKHPIVTGPEAPCILGIDCLRNGYFKDPKGYRWAFGIAAVETEDIRQLSTLPGLSDDSCAVGLLRVEEQQVPIATTTVHRRQYRTDRDSVIPIHEMIQKLESQGVVSKAHSPFNSPIWPVRKSSGEWRLTVDYRALNEVTPPLSAAVPDMLELQYELESKAAKWYATIDIANTFFSIPLAAECRAQFAFTWKGVQYTWNRLPQGWKHSPTICHGLIQTTLEKGEAPEHLQYIDDIIVWGNTAGEVFEKGEKIIQILLKAGFAIKRSKVKGPAQEIQFLGVKWQDGRRQIPTEVINKIIAMSPPTSKKETQAFLGAIGFWRMHIPEYSQIVSPLYLVTRKKNDFHWGPEQQQAFAQIKQEIAHAVALGPVRTGPEVKNVLYSAAGNNGLSWSLWQKVPGETRGRPLGFWSQSYRGSEANYTPTEKEILAAYEGLQAASEVIGTETQLLLAPRLPVLGWMFKGKVPSTHHATDTTWSKWIALITQRARIGNPNRPGILEIITNWPEDIAARVEKLTVKVRHVDAHVSKSQANEEHHNNEQVDKAAKVKVSQVDLDWHHKGEVFLARWAHDASGHQGRDATYRWARDRGVDLTMDNISQVIHNCETCAAIKQAKRVKPLWYGGRWLKYRYGEAWQIDYITLPQTRQGKRYVLTMVEATTGWLETYPVPHATARNTILGLQKQVLWRHGTPERIESDNGTHFKNGLINTWAREHGIEWIYHIPYHAPAAGKVERCNGLLKTTLKALSGGTFKNWELNLAKATWMVNTRGSINRAGPAQSEPLHTVDGDKVPVVHMKGVLGKTVWINPTSSKGRPIRGIVFAQGPGSTWWVMQKDGETRCVPQGDLILSEN